MKKLWFATSAVLMCLTVSLAACSGFKSGGKTPAHTHTFAQVWSSDETGHWRAATCDHADERGDFAPHSYQNGTCTECHYEHQGHTYEGSGCTVCGKLLYTMSADETKLYFGEYPQTEVTDRNDPDGALRSGLAEEAGSMPTGENAGKWTDYGYYNNGTVQSYMWYIDIEYAGGKYRGIYFTSYRPEDTTTDSNWGDEFSYQDDNGYAKNTVYWFKFEPIEWRILEEKNGTALLMANVVLDSQQYYHEDSGKRTIGGKTVYLNNYAESDIRTWLNETFCETAFGEAAKQIIEKATVDNSVSSTGYDVNEYACEDTQDQVFLLSYQDVLNASYGFSADGSASVTRQLKPTDYAKSQGIETDPQYSGASWWWLRSPRANRNFTCYIHASGDTNAAGSVYVYGGVVPALRITL